MRYDNYIYDEMIESYDNLDLNKNFNDPIIKEFADLLNDEINDISKLLKEDEELKKENKREGYKPGADDMAPQGHQWVYVFMVDAKEFTTKVIKHFTKQPYNHAALSFDKSLTNMASFVMGENFRRENIHTAYKPEATFSLYKIAVPNDAVSVMKDAVRNIEHLKGGKNEYKYSLAGLIGFIDTRHQAKYNTDEKKMFCSQFVARMFATAGLKIFKNHDYEIRPYDFAKNKNFKFCYRGKVKNYDPSRVR